MADREHYDWDNPWAPYRQFGERPSRRLEDRRLDDRTAMEPGSPGGYRGDGRREERSFRSGREYPHLDRGAYRPEYTAPDMRDDDYRQAMARATFEAAGYQDHPSNAYRTAGSGVGPNFGFGHDLGGGYSARPPRHQPAHERDFWDKASDEVSSWMGDEAAHVRREMDHRQGRHAGRGPKGYQRSDGRIEEDVCEHLSRDAWLDASDIEVKVQDHEVTLDGKVRSRDDKRRAELCAEHVSGVTHVQNNLRVAAAGAEPIPPVYPTAGK